MDHMESFYVVLPSNSSMMYFPDNTTTCYTTHLSREIKLSGQWEVGLAEIHIPCTIAHIQRSEGYFSFKLGTADEKPGNDTHYFPYGVYESVEELAEEINKVLDVRQHQQLIPTEFQKGYYMLKRTCVCKEPHYTMFNEKIHRIFGFESDMHRETGTFVTSNTGVTVNVGNRPACLARAIPDQLFIYTDICEPYTVGDTQAALLRIVNHDTSKYKFGTNIVKQYGPIQYIPLLHHTFQNIIIDIRDAQGRQLPFEYGCSNVTLHFRRCR